jgi:hypothetical protein
MPRKPPERHVDPEVSFSWPGQRRPQEDPTVVDVRLAARAQRQAQRQAQAERDAERDAQREAMRGIEAPHAEPPAVARAQPPATRSQSTAAGARERWIVTELRRQAVTTESALRDMSERVDQLGRTLRQIAEFLPRLQGRTGAGSGGARGATADAVITHRLDELEARIEARLDEIAGATFAAPPADSGRGAARIDAVDVRSQVRDEMTTFTQQLADLGEHLRAELVTSAGQAEARLNRDRDQLRETLNQTMGKLNELVGGAVSRDDLRQYWVEMAARLAKQHDVAVSEREQLRQDLAERFDQIADEREQLRRDISDRLARVAEAAAVREHQESTDTKPVVAAVAAQKVALDELRRELHQLGAQLLAATNPKNRKAGALDDGVIEALKQSMAQAAAALSSTASKNDVEALRNQLAGTVTRLERAFVSRFEQEQHTWEEQLGTALEAVHLSIEGVELNRQAMLAEVSSAVRAALSGVMGPLPTA